MRLILACLLALSLPASALACSCAPPFGNSFLAPALDAVDVPTNARVWLGPAEVPGTGDLFNGDEPSLDALELVTMQLEDGTMVPFTASLMKSSWQALFILTPDVELEPDTRYEVLTRTEVGDPDTLVARFRTGNDADLEPPSLPVTTSFTVRADTAFPPDGNSCGPTDGISLEISSDEDVVVADLLGRATLDTDTLHGDVPDYRSNAGSGIWLTNGGCTFSWSDVTLGDVAEWQLGAFDVAGNFSGWSDVETATINAANATSTQAGCGAGCSAAGGSMGLLLPLLLVGRRRRA